MPTKRIATEPVIFQTKRLNLRQQINKADTELTDPTAALHPDVKMAEFFGGLHQTSDPETITFLDKHPDVWRVDDPAAALKAQYGPEEYEKLKVAFAQVNVIPEDTSSDKTPEEGEQGEENAS